MIRSHETHVTTYYNRPKQYRCYTTIFWEGCLDATADEVEGRGEAKSSGQTPATLMSNEAGLRTNFERIYERLDELRTSQEVTPETLLAFHFPMRMPQASSSDDFLEELITSELLRRDNQRCSRAMNAKVLAAQRAILTRSVLFQSHQQCRNSQYQHFYNEWYHLPR